MASALEYRRLDKLDEVPNGTLKRYIKTNDDDFMGYIVKMPTYTGRNITNILNRGNNPINDTNTTSTRRTRSYYRRAIQLSNILL